MVAWTKVGDSRSGEKGLDPGYNLKIEPRSDLLLAMRGERSNMSARFLA